MKRRHKWMVSLSVAAACAVIFAALALATGQLTRPRPDIVAEIPQAERGGAATKVQTEISGDEVEDVLAPDITPEPVAKINGVYVDVTPDPDPTPVATPEPTPVPEQTDGLTIVYTQPQGNYYHSVQDCSGMLGAIEWTEASAISVGKQPCPVCITGEVAPAVTNTPTPVEEPIEAPVYYTPQGKYFHGDDQCSGMQGAQAHTLSEAEAEGKERCPVCQPVEPDHYDLFKAAFGSGLEALTPGYAYSHSGGGDGFFDDGAWFVTDGAEVFPICQVFDYLAADGGDFQTNSALGSALEDVLCVSFYSEKLDALWDFLPGSEVGAIAFHEQDEAIEDAIEAEQLEAPMNLEEGNVWVAIGSDGVIRELEVYYIDVWGGGWVTVGWVLTGDGYALKSRVEISDTLALAEAEPVSMTEEARAVTARRYVRDTDDYYHSDSACPQLAYTDFSAVSRHEAVEMGRKPCPMCQPDRPLDATLFYTAFDRTMLDQLLPDSYYAYTRTISYIGEYSWYFRSREDEDTYSVMATFQTRPHDSGDEPMPDNFEEGGVRMKVWMNPEVDYVSMLKNEASEPMRAMAREAEAALMEMPSMEKPDGSSPLGWNMWVYACFDAARENMTSVDFLVDGPDSVHFQWQRQEDGTYDLTNLVVKEEAMG